jgi:hypothetical protein
MQPLQWALKQSAMARVQISHLLSVTLGGNTYLLAFIALIM